MRTEIITLTIIRIIPTEYPTFPDRLRFAMDLRGYSIQKLANRTYLSHSTISGYRLGYRMPNTDNLTRIAQVLRVSTDFLLGISNYVEKIR